MIMSVMMLRTIARQMMMVMMVMMAMTMTMVMMVCRYISSLFRVKYNYLILVI
jgi:hypothetical protein